MQRIKSLPKPLRSLMCVRGHKKRPIAERWYGFICGPNSASVDPHHFPLVLRNTEQSPLLTGAGECRFAFISHTLYWTRCKRLHSFVGLYLVDIFHQLHHSSLQKCSALVVGTSLKGKKDGSV